MSKVHIHEDDEGMRNVYPAHAINEVMDDIAAAKVHSVENLAPNGVFWTSVYGIKKPEKSFLEIGLDWQSFANALGKILPKVEEFEMGFGANNFFRYKDHDPICFGFGQSMYIKLETDGDYLEAIWFDTRSNVEEELSALRRALEAIDEIHPLMIADYWLDTGGLIGDQAFIDAYIEGLRGTAVPSTGPSNINEEPISPTLWSKIIMRLFGTR